MASPPSSPSPAKKPKMSASTSDTEPEMEPDTNADPSAAPAERRRRYKRRKVAILLGYCGHGYQGMQKNPGARTIEGDLEEALFHSGAVPEADRGAPKRYDWARAARTDKGVSAAAQVVSGRFYVDPPGLVARLNGQLPDQIRIFGYKRVTNSFNAKKFCDRRRYVYLLPVFALDPSAHPDREAVMASLGSGNELAKCIECSERGRKVPGLMGREPKGERSDLGEGDNSDLMNADLTSEGIKEADNGESVANEIERPDLGSGVAIGETPVNENEVKSNGESELKEGETCATVENKPMLERLANEEKCTVEQSKSTTNGEKLVEKGSRFSYGNVEMERLNRILKYFVGTHNFHNFTTRTKAEDPSARRYIISFTADSVVTLDGIDFVKCEVVGQSFMLHQIRKMIGLAVAIMRNCCPESLMEVALKREVRINVPTAPEVGLFLDECLFSSYNKKWKDSHEEVSMKAYGTEVEEFKMKYIYSHIASMEHKEGAVALWLHSLNRRNYPDFNSLETNKGSAGDEQINIDNNPGQ